MTIETTTNRISYTGSGTTGPFSFPYYFLADGDLTVIKTTIADGTESTLTLTTDYTVSGAGEAAGGSVTLVATLSSSYKLTIIRDPDILQPADYPANDRFPAATHEEALDRATMISQRLKDLIDRSFRLSDGDVSGISLILQNLGAGKLIAVNSAGTGIESIAAADVDLTTVSAFIQTLFNDADAATARTTLGAASLGANTFTGIQQLDYSSDIASGATVDLGTATGNSVSVTHSSGTTAITSFGGAATVQKGSIVAVIPSISGGTLTVTHHATNMILPGGANITLASGDVLLMMKNHDSNAEWRCINYLPAAFVPSVVAQGTAEAGTDTTPRQWTAERVKQAIKALALTKPTAVAASGTAVDFSGIAPGATVIFIGITALSTNGTSLPIIVIGDSGGIEPSGYTGTNMAMPNGAANTGQNMSSGFGLSGTGTSAATVLNGLVILSRQHGTNTWNCAGVIGTSTAATAAVVGGYKNLSAELTQVSITTAGGADTFDSGTLSISYL